MSLCCLISCLVVCHQKAFFVCCAIDMIKALLFRLLTANSKICSERFHSHIFSSLSTGCGLSDKAGWIHSALTKIPFKRENGIECHSITADGKHGDTLTQKAFTLTYTKQCKDHVFGFPMNPKYVQYWSVSSQSIWRVVFQNALTYLISSLFTICQAQSHNALWNEFLMWSNEAVMAKQSLLVWVWLML